MIMIIYGSSSTNSQLSSDPCSGIYCILYIIWVFPKIGVPQIIHFNRDVHYKPSILGYHYFWKHPYYNQFWQSYIHIVLASFCGSSQHQTAQLTKNQPPIQAKRALALATPAKNLQSFQAWHQTSTICIKMIMCTCTFEGVHLSFESKH